MTLTREEKARFATLRAKGVANFPEHLLRQLVDSAGGTEPAAELCGVTAKRVREWLRQGRLRRIHLHKLMRAHRAKLTGVPMDIF
jgi:hypothetical protein